MDEEKEYEYRRVGDTEFISVPANSSEINGLVYGEYEVRYAPRNELRDHDHDDSTPEQIVHLPASAILPVKVEFLEDNTYTLRVEIMEDSEHKFEYVERGYEERIATFKVTNVGNTKVTNLKTVISDNDEEYFRISDCKTSELPANTYTTFTVTFPANQIPRLYPATITVVGTENMIGDSISINQAVYGSPIFLENVNSDQVVDLGGIALEQEFSYGPQVEAYPESKLIFKGGNLPRGIVFKDGQLIGKAREEGIYTFLLEASNTYGGNTYTTEQSYTIEVGVTAPSVPQNVTAISHGDEFNASQVLLTWDEPEISGGTPIIYYKENVYNE